MERVQGHLEKLVADRSTPFAIHEVVLTSGTESGARLQGQPDLLIWTGDHWLLADIKCSEQARRSHGIQIAAYDRMLAAMLPQDRRSEKGCVIHCATGFRFTAASGRTTQADRLRHTQATAFPIDLLEPTLDELLALLGDTSDDAVRRAEQAAVFSSACNECAYRMDCFQRFAQQGHVSLLPFAKAQLKVLSEAKVRTIDQVREAIDSPEPSLHKRLLELFENSELHLSFLKQKIEMVARCGCYSSWMPGPSGSQQPLFFTSAGEDVCFDPDPSGPFNPTSLVDHGKFGKWSDPEDFDEWSDPLAHDTRPDIWAATVIQASRIEANVEVDAGIDRDPGEPTEIEEEEGEIEAWENEEGDGEHWLNLEDHVPWENEEAMESEEPMARNRTHPCDVLLLDEAGQIPAYSAAALSFLAPRMILFGDEDQLPTIFQGNHPPGSHGDSSAMASGGASRGFTRLGGFPPHECRPLCALIRRHFYPDIALQAGRHEHSSLLDLPFQWPGSPMPTSCASAASTRCRARGLPWSSSVWLLPARITVG